jgi:transcriptional regulator with XRE-family HTH domain
VSRAYTIYFVCMVNPLYLDAAPPSRFGIDVPTKSFRLIGMLGERSIEHLCVIFGRRVRAARRAAGLTPTGLGGLVGLSRSSIANLEAGRQRVPIHVIWNLSAALGVPVRDLVPEPVIRTRATNPAVNRLLGQEPRLGGVSPTSVNRIRAFLKAKLAESAAPSEVG